MREENWMGSEWKSTTILYLPSLFFHNSWELDILSNFGYLNFAIISILYLEHLQILLNIFALEKFIWVGDWPSNKILPSVSIYLTALIY